MGGKVRIDWERVEKEYFSRTLTIQEIAKKYGIADSTLRQKAKACGWVRDIKQEVGKRLEQKLAEMDAYDIRELLGKTPAEELKESAIESAAMIKAAVVKKHRKMLGDDVDRAKKLEEKFDTLVDSISDVRDFASVTQSFKSIVESKSKLIVLERQSFKIEDTPENDHTDKRISFNITFV